MENEVNQASASVATDDAQGVNVENQNVTSDQSVNSAPLNENAYTSQPGFTELMDGYDEDAELHELFPAIKDQNFTADTFRNELPDNVKDKLREVFKKTGFNQRQANVAMMLAADSYCSGINNANDLSLEDINLLASDEYKQKTQRVEDFFKTAQKHNVVLKDKETDALKRFCSHPEGISVLDILAKVSIAERTKAGNNIGGSAVITSSTSASSSSNNFINGNNYKSFPVEQQVEFLKDVASGKRKDEVINSDKADLLLVAGMVTKNNRRSV